MKKSDKELDAYCERLMEAAAVDSPYCHAAGGPSIKEPSVMSLGDGRFLVIDNTDDEGCALEVPRNAIQAYIARLEDGEDISFGAFYSGYKRGL